MLKNIQLLPELHFLAMFLLLYQKYLMCQMYRLYRLYISFPLK